MTVRVRFAPSPTGLLHIGNARTAIYNYLYAKATNGTFILRVEDTDEERSTKEFEKKQIEIIKWLGIDYDEGPDKSGDYGPYRQSERKSIYNDKTQELLNKGVAYYCFCSSEELENKKHKLQDQGLPPHYDGKCKNISLDQARQKISNGEKAIVRLKAPSKDYHLKDHVRGDVTFPKDMVGDFVIMRSNGMPVYNFCCVVDDSMMKITHVIRGEDHLNNTVRQLIVYEALECDPPEFAHASLLIGEDRQKLSKRHAATSLVNYKDASYTPAAVVNYLSLLGWSHPEEKDVFDLEELKKVFSISRFNKAPAIFDIQKFKYINGQHLKNKDEKSLLKEITPFIDKNSAFHQQSKEWQAQAINFFREHIDLYKEINDEFDVLFSTQIANNDKIKEIISWESTPIIKEYIKNELIDLEKSGKNFIDNDIFIKWAGHIKKELKIKGKFLFMGLRAVLTGKDSGRELKDILPLTPINILKQRIEKI